MNVSCVRMPFSFALLISVAVYDMILDYSSNKYNSGDCP